MCPVTHTYAENGDLATSREYMEFDTKADLQGVSLVQSYAYDAVGRTTEVTYKQGEAVKEKYTQNYDGRNYITQDSYTDGYGSTAKTLNRTYQYDAIGRLTETDVTNSEKTKTTGYQYDKVGNRLYQTVADGTKTVSTKYTYNALGQLTATQKGLGTAGSVTNWLNEELYTYDACGNQTGVEVYEVNDEVTSTEKAGDVRYTYDEANQMVKYETKGTEEESWTEKARNVYNGEGMRVRQYENGNSWARQYFYIGGALSISTDGSNENFVKSENILTPDGTILAALREAKAGEEIEGNAYWIYHYDARGSATNLVGAKNGSLYRAEENIYDAFGNKEEEIKQSTSSVVNDIKFTGATLDNSGTYYLGSRHYDPNTGRFLQQDTFKGEAYSPWTQNLYTYTSNNPVNYVDPTGHWSYPCNNNSPFYKPGQSYNDAMRLYRQERSAGRIPQVPKQTSKPPTGGGGGGTTSPGNSRPSSVHNHGRSSNIASTGSTSGTFKDPFLKQEGQSNWEYNIKVKGIMHDFVCFYVALQVGGSCFRSLNGFPNIGPKGGYGYVDVMRGNEYWEVKPQGVDPKAQMERYDKTGLQRGGEIQEMYLPYGYGLLHVTNGPPGVVWYEYLSTPEKYPEAVRAYETSQARVNYARANVSSAFGKLTAGEAPQMTGAEWGWVIIGALLIGSFTLATT